MCTRIFAVSYSFRTHFKPLQRRKRPWRWRISKKRSTISRIIAGNTWKVTNQARNKRTKEPKLFVQKLRVFPSHMATDLTMGRFDVHGILQNVTKIRSVRINFESKKGKKPSPKNLRTVYRRETGRLRSVKYCVKIKYFLPSISEQNVIQVGWRM